MITDTKIKSKGIQVLNEYLGDVEADYTKWRQDLDENLSINEISGKAMLLRKQSGKEQ